VLWSSLPAGFPLEKRSLFGFKFGCEKYRPLCILLINKSDKKLKIVKSERLKDLCSKRI
jgi:hypothetical protein